MAFLKRQPDNSKLITFSIKTEPELRMLLEEIAIDKRQTLSFTVNEILREALKDQLVTLYHQNSEADRPS